MVLKDKVYCMYKKCPGWNIKQKTRRAHRTNYKCEECTIEKGNDMWLCNTVKSGKAIECHIRYHSEKEFIVLDGTECSVISDLTDE